MKLGLGILGLRQARVRARARACFRAILLCLILKKVLVAH